MKVRKEVAEGGYALTGDQEAMEEGEVMVISTEMVVMVAMGVMVVMVVMLGMEVAALLRPLIQLCLN